MSLLIKSLVKLDVFLSKCNPDYIQRFMKHPFLTARYNKIVTNSCMVIGSIKSCFIGYFSMSKTISIKLCYLDNK